MEKGGGLSVLGCLVMILSFFLLVDCSAKIHADRRIPHSNQGSAPPVQLQVLDNHVEIDNGIVKLTLLKPSGMITGVGYKGINNVLEYRFKETQRGYWDIVWSRPEIGKSFFDTLQCTSFKVIAKTKDQVEVSFTKTWNVSLGDNVVPLNIDKRFIVLRGASGFYSYAIFEHLKGWPDLNVDEARIAFKLHQDMFHYMAISDDKQRIMPSDRDRTAGHVLDYREAVLLTNPANPNLKGEVDDKYQYSCENKDNRVHGWISSNPRVGFWVITPSDEFRAGGACETRPHIACWPDFLSLGITLVRVLEFDCAMESTGRRSLALFSYTLTRMSEETKKWPYDFPMSVDFPRASQRGTISGRLLVRDRYISRELMPAKSAYVGLAPPGNAGSWQEETKGYQFWTRTDDKGYFTIHGVRADTYNLYASVPGIIGDYKHDIDVIIRPGSKVQIGDLVYDPPRHGPTLWEIGIPDRSAAEFYIPDPAPGLINKLFINHKDKFRQYGLWDRYTELYPTEDLVYTVGVSDYHKDWFFAHVNRNVENNYTPTTWQIMFDVRNVSRRGTYTLRLALASANFAEIQVWINNPYGHRPLFTTRRIGTDNVIARHGIHGQYWLYSINLSGFQLVNGRNTIYLKQARGSSPFAGVMYDYIRLEGPPQAYYN
ncbi:UNVERIFIED_CONTAM: hypothetical protein Sangu_0234400 [Sesamum angustifolium]|uniref:Rhamnogalacturonan endolyase n=1 Tax=Sesamum angustifolium TaxID=2727405 RepID=A0AAW2RQF7_9LAMI